MYKGPRFSSIPRTKYGGSGGPTLTIGLDPPSTTMPPAAAASAPELSPRGKHQYPPLTPWSCHHIAAWLALVFAFVALVLVCILYFPSGDHHHHGLDDDDKRRILLLESGAPQQQPHENYVVFKFEGKPGVNRWPETGVVAGLRLEDIAATRLCCVVGPEEYFVCDSSQSLTSNLGMAYVVRNVKQEGGAHLLIAASSTDMNMATCIFSWQTRVREHDKAALVTAAAPKEIAPPPSTPARRRGHVHGGHARD
jgi:hypothetical protein